MIKTIVSVQGKMGSGKTTVADILQNKHGFFILPFAKELKEIVKRITPDGGIKKARDRELLQFLGSEYFRKIDEDYWVKRWKEGLDRYDCNYPSGVRIVVDDCRFQNEQSLLSSLGAYFININVNDRTRQERLRARDGAYDPQAEEHISEGSINYSLSCYTLFNNEDLETLNSRVEKCAQSFMFLTNK